MKIEEYFLFLIQILSCDPSSELSHQDGSDEESQHMFLYIINKKLSLIVNNLEL